uniref:60S ribosome subunit biogenesis protein NIP7 homolog n=1 Tax=Lotharella vacuolata TaxID=74820 RepID=A0A0H5BHS8_9EUKA|nr:putative ribosome biogenesis protein Nip7 [Lotharella vacuolata]
MRTLYKSEIKILFKIFFNIMGINLKEFLKKIKKRFFLRNVNKQIFLFDKSLLNINIKDAKIITLGIYIGKFIKKHTKNFKINYFCLNLFTNFGLNKVWIKKSSLKNVLSRFMIYERDISLISKLDINLRFAIVYSEEGLLVGCGFIIMKKHKKNLIKVNFINLFCHIKS